MAAAVRSHEVPATTSAAEARKLRRALSCQARMPSQAATNSAGVAAMGTTSAYCCATSRTGVLTIGLPAARYSSVLVGLMKRVDALSAKGIMQTSQPARKAGSSS